MSNANPLVDINTEWKDWNSLEAAPTVRHPSAGYIFPAELDRGGRPVLKISCNQVRSNFFANPPIVFLPAPGGLSFENASTYDNAELGIVGAATLGAIKNKLSGDSINAVAKNAAATSLSDLLGITAKEAIGAESAIGRAIGIGSRATLNKNVTTEFTGSNTREFSFSYRLVPANKGEAETIRGIISALTLGVYPEVTGGGAILKYPPTWTVEILDGPNGRRLPGVPRIFECYLRSFSSNYNSSSNSYFSDGSPIEVEISMTFVETRAMNAQDISKLLSDKP